MRSYVAIHMALIFGIGGLITGSIWAKASWGHWWVWNEPTLVSYLIVVLLFATYQPLRFSIEDPERQARYASVFAVTAGAFVPLNFIAVRLAQQFVHPACSPSAAATCRARCASRSSSPCSGIALLFATLWKYEMAAKNTPDPAAPRCAARCSATTRWPRWAAARRRREPRFRRPPPRSRCTPRASTSPPPTSCSSR